MQLFRAARRYFIRMLQKICISTALLILSLFLPVAAIGQPLAIVDVTVIPMVGDILQNQTVLVSDGRILEIGKSSDVKIPRSAFQINGKNRFLIPGFTDAHTHLV